MAPLAFTLSVGCCIIVLGDLDMRCRLSLVLMYVSLLLLVGCGKNFSLSHKTTPSFLTPHTGQTPYTLAPYTEFALPQLSEKDCASGPQGITVGPDGALWFTEPELDKIGRITTQGQVSEFALPIARMGPAEITAGPDGPSGLPSLDPTRSGASLHRDRSPSLLCRLLLTPLAMVVGLRPGPMEPSGLLRAGVRLGGSPRRGTSPCFPHTIQAGPGGLSLGTMALFG